MPQPGFGATVGAEGTHFRVWAPDSRVVELVLQSDSDEERCIPLAAADDGQFQVFVQEAAAGARYGYRLDGGPRFPDPASRYQPEGVHGASQVIDPSSYRWHDQAWKGVAQRDLVFYELHVGTFSPDGTFEGTRRRLGHLQQLGVTALELMPVADFPGERNWGYDPASLWAPSHAYGHPDELRRLVDEAHRLGLAVFLDVIYNHFSPDGAYLCAFGPFLTPEHQTPWGQAINLDGPGSAVVREFLWANALHWLQEYHLDGLRLDAIFALCDDSPEHWLAGLAERVSQLEGPPRCLIGEDNRNLDTVIRPASEGGYGLQGIWADDLHHLVRRTVAGDRHGYYADYPDSCEAIARTLTQGWYYTGQHSQQMGHARGTDPTGIPAERFVICIQNHDQVGNRPFGDRLHHQIDAATYRAASALLLLSPQLPLLFMGQEWAASSPFNYFTDHEPELGERVRQGRRDEFKDFPGFSGDVPDPQAAASFDQSKLGWDERQDAAHARVEQLYRDLLTRRRQICHERPFSATSPLEGGLVLRFGHQTLLVALREAIALPLAGRQAHWLWHSEQPEYVPDDPLAPLAEDRQVLFRRPGALLMEEG